MTWRIAICCLALGCSDGVRGDGKPPAPVAAAIGTTTAAPSPSGATQPIRPVVPSRTLGPFLVEGTKYTVDLERYAAEGDTGVGRIVVKDSAGRAVYDENLLASTESDGWAGLDVHVLEDPRGRPRALLLDYGFYPSAPGTGESFRLLVPRGGRLVALAPPVDDAGASDMMKIASQPSWQRLAEGNILTLLPWRYSFAATIPIRIDLDCTPGAESCVTLALADSIDGLSRFAVKATVGKIEDTVGVPLFARPDSTTKPQRVPIAPGDTVEVLGGAGRVRLERGKTLYIHISDEWLQIRVNGFSGWIHGDKSFLLIGLPLAG